MTFTPSTQGATRLARVTCAFALLVFAAGAALYLTVAPFGEEAVFYLACLVVFAGVGQLVASRQPGNPIGWIFCGIAVVIAFTVLADGYTLRWMDGRAARRLGEVTAAFAEAAWVPWVLIPATFLPLLFPDGRLLSRRWRWVARAAAAGIAGMFLTEVTGRGELDSSPGHRNVLGLDHPLLEAVEVISVVLLLIALIASPASLYLRLRRSRGRERQQVKWLAWAGALAGAMVVLGTAFGYRYAGEAVTNGVILSSILMLPVATGVAILRYRLYDVDIVINRTLVYGALTLTLAATYLGVVVLAGLAVGDSDVTIAASTLAVAGLFRPLRTRIQAAVDRRFYRRRYDAGVTLAAFGSRLRDEVDLETLGSDLRGVVAETMQPAHVSLWLRKTE